MRRALIVVGLVCLVAAGVFAEKRRTPNMRLPSTSNADTDEALERHARGMVVHLVANLAERAA